MKKNELIEFIDRALRVEEDAVAQLSKHIKAASSWSRFDAADMDKVSVILTHLHDDSAGHAKKLLELRKYVAEGDKDVY